MCFRHFADSCIDLQPTYSCDSEDKLYKKIAKQSNLIVNSRKSNEATVKASLDLDTQPAGRLDQSTVEGKIKAVTATWSGEKVAEFYGKNVIRI